MCARMLLFPDNLFQPRDRAITGKEMQLRSKRWVSSQSLPWHPVRCFFFFAGRFFLSLVLLSHVKAGPVSVTSPHKICCSCFSARTFALIVFFPPLPRLACLFSFLTDPSIYSEEMLDWGVTLWFTQDRGCSIACSWYTVWHREHEWKKGKKTKQKNLFKIAFSLFFFKIIKKSFCPLQSLSLERCFHIPRLTGGAMSVHLLKIRDLTNWQAETS